MRALVFDGRLQLRDLPLPVPGAGESLVRVLTAGICRTDLEIVQGYMGFRGVLGHEFVGVVEVCAADASLVGRRVCGEINISPGAADSLARRHAAGRSVLGIQNKDGCFAEYLTLPTENLFVVPDAVDSDTAVFTEPLAAALEITEQIAILPESRVAVCGDGKLGLLCAQVLAPRAAELLLIGRHADKLVIAAACGIATCLQVDLSTTLRRSFDIVVDCTGKPDGLALCLSLLRPRGTLVLKTTTAVPPSFNTAAIVIDELTVIGSRCGQFPPALRKLAEGRIRVSPLIDSRFPLAEGLAAFARAASPGALKVLLDIGDVDA